MTVNTQEVTTMKIIEANCRPSQKKRRRPYSISVVIPRTSPLSPNMSYNRRLSPGAQRIAHPARASDSLTDAYRQERHNSYTSPRTSAGQTSGGTPSGGGVIPISTQTFINYPASATSATRPVERFDSYSGRPIDPYTGRPRRSSLIDTQRGATSTLPSRTRPNVVQTDSSRPISPNKNTVVKEYYIQPASSKETRPVEHKKKVYSVNDGTASLVADVELPSTSERHHRRRESDSGERQTTYKSLKPSERDNDRGRRGYHLNGPSRPKERSIDDVGAYSYTDARGMFRDTEPSWREQETRPRRGSVDRGGASRERPISMLDPGYDPRRNTKDPGPPPSTRGWAKLNDGLGRTTSLREKPRDVPQSPNRARVPQSPNRARAPTSPSRGRYGDVSGYGDSRDPYYPPPRTTSRDRHNDRPAYDYEYDDRKEPRRHERRNSVTRPERPDRPMRPDHSVERRGFGIRSDSQDRYGRGSDENMKRQEYRDSGYEPHRRDTAPELSYHEEQRLMQEKDDRIRRTEERERYVERDGPRRDDGGYSREYDRERDVRRDREYDVDRERERERERMMQPPPPDPRHHPRRESNRDFGYGDAGSRATESGAQSGPGLGSVVAGGLAGGIAAPAATKYAESHKRADDRERDRDADVDRRNERPRERYSPQPADQRSRDTHSDEGLRYSQDRDRRRDQDKDRGLGFAFENAPEPPMSAPPMREPYPPRDLPRDTPAERDLERPHGDRAPSQVPPQAQPVAALDPDEDYRRRLEQVQRDLGRAPEDRPNDTDPDRERRRREREQRQRERHANGDPSMSGALPSSDAGASSRMPGSFDNDDVGSGRPGLARKSSILDEPMMNEPAQIIDNSMSERRENRVRIVDPPTEEEEKKPKGILKKPTDKFPEHPTAMREGVAPLKDAKNSGIPPGARWTKIDRKLVNPQALEEAKERFEERLDCVIVLRVLTKEDIQKLADRTKEIRDERYEEEREERRAARRHERHHDRKERDEYDDDSEDEFKPRQPRLLEAPSSTVTGTSNSDHTVSDYIRDGRDGRDKRGDRDRGYVDRRREEGY